jgi:tRNA-specific 2-thiouridylase
VIQIDTDNNLVFTGQGEDHFGLNRWALFIVESEIHWINKAFQLSNGEHLQAEVRIRYRQKLQKATLYKREEGMYILFENVQRGITPGQFAAWYINEELIGSGVISQ